MNNFNLIWFIVIGLSTYSVFCLIQFCKSKDKIYKGTKLTKAQLKVIENFILKLHPRDFEFFVSYLFNYKGYATDVTPATNDKGRDIIVYGYKGNDKTYVECKKYDSSNLIGREIVDKLLGACTLDGVRSAIIVTTSTYTKTAIECKKQCEWLELWYLDDLLEIIKGMTEQDLYKYLGIVVTEDKIIFK